MVSEFAPPLWLWLPPLAKVEDLKAASELTHFIQACDPSIASTLTQVLWCQRTWLEFTGNTFCQVGRLRVSKAGISNSTESPH